MNKKLVLLSSGAILTAGFLALTSARPVVAARADSSPVSVSVWENGTWNPFGWGTHDLSNAGLVDHVAANNQANMWANHMLQFCNSEYQEFAISFNAYDSTDDAVSNNGDGLDIYLMSADGSSQIQLLRIWTQAWGAHNGNHSVAMYGSGWGKSTPLTEAGNIVGDATSSSEFHIRVSRQYGIECLDTWDKWDHASDATILGEVQTALADAYGYNLVIGGDGGFARDVDVTIKSFNGQSFANDGTYFNANEAPIVTLSASEVNAYKNIPFAVPSVHTYDVLDGGEATVSVKDGATAVGSTYAYDNAGAKTLTVTASDIQGEATVKNITVNVADTTADAFCGWLDGTHEEGCYDKYVTAKTIYKGMDAAEKAAFNDGTHAASVARYEAWCTANGDANPYGDVIVSASSAILEHSSLSNTWTILALGAAVGLAASALLLARKKKDE